MIFQDFNLFEQSTVLKNVMYPLEISGKHYAKSLMKELARNYLKLVDLEGKENSYPSQLSGGQKQRVAIARALASEPSVLLCDECTSALDPTTATQILDLIKGLNKKLGLTVVIIAHQMSVIERICNKVAILNDHRIVEVGNTEKIFLNPKSEASKRLVYSGHIRTRLHESNLIKLTFKGNPDVPIITDIIQQCNILVSIVYANSWVTDGKVYGSVIIKLPYYREDIKKLKAFLTSRNIWFKEIKR